MKSARILLRITVALVLGLFFATPTLAAGILQSAKVSMSTSQPGQSSNHTFGFTVGSAGNVKTITFTYCKEASGTCTVPTGLGITSAVLNSFSVSGSDNTWTLSSKSDGVLTFLRPDETGEVWAQGAVANIVVNSITNHSIGDCNAASNNSSDTCYVRFATKNLSDTVLDEATATVTVVTAVTATARVDPSFSFVVAGVGANTVNNAITTSVASDFNTLPFGNLTVGVPKYAAHKLTVITNNNSGYSVSMKMTTQLTGTYSANNIDPFSYDGSTWSTPVSWTKPGGTTKNVNTAWIGANTTDTDVESGAYTAGKFGPVPTGASNYNIVMQGAATDDGSTPVYVTYAIEANTYQPGDSYTGTLLYNALPSY